MPLTCTLVWTGSARVASMGMRRMRRTRRSSCVLPSCSPWGRTRLLLMPAQVLLLMLALVLLLLLVLWQPRLRPLLLRWRCPVPQALLRRLPAQPPLRSGHAPSAPLSTPLATRSVLCVARPDQLPGRPHLKLRQESPRAPLPPWTCLPVQPLRQRVRWSPPHQLAILVPPPQAMRLRPQGLRDPQRLRPLTLLLTRPLPRLLLSTAPQLQPHRLMRPLLPLQRRRLSQSPCGPRLGRSRKGPCLTCPSCL